MRNFHDIEIKKDLVSREDGHNALERVLTSSDFATSPHLSAFLAYCVRETLEGRASALKAYNVATSVLGRPPLSILRPIRLSASRPRDCVGLWSVTITGVARRSRYKS